MTPPEADELAALQLQPAIVREELQAFSFAWQGAIDFQANDGSGALLAQHLPLEDCIRCVSVLAQSANVPLSSE